MALTEDTIVASIDVRTTGIILVRRVNRVFRDGVEISQIFHRHVVSPGDDLSLVDPIVAAIGAIVHTEEVIAAFEAAHTESEG